MHRLWFMKALTIVSLILGFNGAGLAQESEFDLKNEIEELKQGQKAIRKDLMELKSLLSKIAAPTIAPQVNIKGMEFELGKNPVRGGDAAKLIMIEFTDYQCPYCGRYVRETYPQILNNYVDKGIIRYIVYDQPLPIHKNAGKAAEASHCANDQGKFWEMHKLMMSKQDSLENLSSYAASLNLDSAKFEECMRSNKYKEQVSQDAAIAQKLGINGVPGFIIASIDPQNPKKVKGISFIRGALPFANFQKELDSALASQ